MPGPIQCVWTGEAFKPLNRRFLREASERYGDGEIVTLDDAKGRSMRSHDHYHAAIHDAWMSLSDEASQRFPSEEHLRKYALIKAGYADSRSVSVASRAEAIRVASFIGAGDAFAVVTTEGATVTVWTAKSQSMKAMGGKVFQESKAATLDVIADLIGTTSATLQANAGMAA